MKIVVLAAGKNYRHDWPLFIDKPKCLYSYRGCIQLERVIENLKHIAAEEDITIVAGYKAQKIYQFIEQKNYKVRVVENRRYAESAFFSLKAGLEDVDEDVLLLLADESVAVENLKRVAEENNGFVCLVSDKYPYYCLNIFKISSDKLFYFLDERYLTMNSLNDMERFLTNNIELKQYDQSHLQGFMPQKVNMESGVALGLICLDVIRRVGQLDQVVRILNKETPSDVTTTPYNEESDYLKDLDNFRQTDEYRIATVTSENAGMLYSVERSETLCVGTTFDNLVLRPGQYVITVGIGSLDHLPDAMPLEVISLSTGIPLPDPNTYGSVHTTVNWERIDK